MTSTPYKVPSAYKTLEEFLEANISAEMREILKGFDKIDAYCNSPPENSLNETKRPNTADDGPAYYHYSMPGKRLTEKEWEDCLLNR